MLRSAKPVFELFVYCKLIYKSIKKEMRRMNLPIEFQNKQLELRHLKLYKSSIALLSSTSRNRKRRKTRNKKTIQ